MFKTNLNDTDDLLFFSENYFYHLILLFGDLYAKWMLISLTIYIDCVLKNNGWSSKTMAKSGNYKNGRMSYPVYSVFILYFSRVRVFRLIGIIYWSSRVTEVVSDMLLISDHVYSLNIMSIPFEIRHLWTPTIIIRVYKTSLLDLCNINYVIATSAWF